jgi:hypothetical protein
VWRSQAVTNATPSITSCLSEATAVYRTTASGELGVGFETMKTAMETASICNLHLGTNIHSAHIISSTKLCLIARE